MRLSCAVSAWNEAKTVDLCLKALVGFADEVIVADSGSIDGTQEIARTWIDRLNLNGEVRDIRAKNVFEFRTKAFNSCGGDWVLMQNSTTILSDALKKELVNHMEKRSGSFCDVHSLNLMGDYEHYFKNRPFMAYHRMLVPRNAEYNHFSSVSEPVFKGPRKHTVNWAVNLSRVRPAWRSWYRGEPFDRRYYTMGNKKWANETNRQYLWTSSNKYYSLIEYVEAEEGKTLEDVKRIAPEWYMRQLQLEATPLTDEYRTRLPEVILEEQKNPRYRLVKSGGKIVGREPEL